MRLAQAQAKLLGDALGTATAASPAAGATLMKLAGVDAGTAGHVLYAIDTAGKKVYTYTDTLSIVPAAGKAVATSPTSASISWTAVANATNYTVKVSVPFGATDTTVLVKGGTADTNKSTGTDPTASVNGMTTGATYTFTIAVAGPDESYATAKVNLVSQPGPGAWNPSLNQNGDLSITPSAGAENVSVVPTLQWNTSAGATGFELIVSKSSTTDANGMLLTSEVVNKTGANAIAGANTTVFTINNVLSNNSTFYWQVRAVYGSGSSATFSPWSGVFAFRTAPAVTTTTPVPPVTVTQVTTIVTTTVITQPITQTVITQTLPPPQTFTVTQPQPTTITYTLPTPEPQATPAWVWAIIAIGGILLIVVIVLIARTRKI